MAARFARGRFGAACVVGVLAWLATAGTAIEVRAQEFAGEWTIEPESTPTGWEEVDAANSRCSECSGYGCEACGGTGCCDGSHSQDCGCCFPCNTSQRWWFDAQMLLWQFDGSHLPPLVTDSPVGTAPTLNLPTTNVLAGDNVVGDSWRVGYRLELGVWFDDCQETALIGDYFNAGVDDYDYYFPGDSGRATGRPYFDAQTGLPAVYEVSTPGVLPPAQFQGTVSVTADDDFQGAGLWVQQRVYVVGDPSGYGPSTQVMVLGGYRFYSYSSQLSISDSRIDLLNPGLNDQAFRHDLFNTDNEFHGGELGVLARFTQTGCWFDGSAKLAVGAHTKRASINGDTSTVTGGVVEFDEGGLLTSANTNIGNYEDSRARFIPSFRVGAGVYLTPQWTAKIGYNLIVWGGVTRAGSIVPPNLAIDPRNIPGLSSAPGTPGPAPVFPGLGGSELIAHGLDLGLEYRY